MSNANSNSRFHFLDEDNWRNTNATNAFSQSQRRNKNKTPNNRNQSSSRSNQFNKSKDPLVSFEFPELATSSSNNKVEQNEPTIQSSFDFKKAIVFEEEVPIDQTQELKPFEVPKGHVLITRNHGSIQIKKSNEDLKREEEEKERKRHTNPRASMIQAIVKNQERHRAKFVEIHGIDEYNRLHCMPSNLYQEDEDDISDTYSVSSSTYSNHGDY
jgi:hypothetical protein